MKLSAFLTAGICLTAAALGIVPASAKPVDEPVDQAIPGKIDHLVVIYEENHSFDNLWGLWPGVNGATPPSPTSARPSRRATTCPASPPPGPATSTPARTRTDSGIPAAPVPGGSG